MKGLIMDFLNARYLTLVFILFVNTGCNKVLTAEPQTPSNAKGDTTIRYIICNVGDVDCKVFARFDNLGSCENYKEYTSALCDSESTPGKIICEKPLKQSSVVTYCTL